jgi:hypothetical protein
MYGSQYIKILLKMLDKDDGVWIVILRKEKTFMMKIKFSSHSNFHVHQHMFHNSVHQEMLLVQEIYYYQQEDERHFLPMNVEDHN